MGGTDGIHTSVSSLRDALAQLLGQARHSVCVSLSSADVFSDTVRELLAARKPGPMVRVLLSAPIADRAFLAGLGDFADSRFEVRCSEDGLRNAVVVDGSQAMVCGAPGSGGQATVVADAAAARALELLFAGTWSRCRRLDDHLALSPRLRSEQTRRILERLLVGRTDDVAARELSVSLRTYRRHVAEIMRELGARSRFQAGARAVELGLL
ncbi:DNA-binding response regulator [Streptomyces sp. NPDC004752]